MSATQELYVYWSHFNFTANQWREAAKRFLELQVALNVAAAKDAEIDHDEDFFDCGVCRELSELQEHYNEFARAFANLWAMRALKGEPK